MKPFRTQIKFYLENPDSVDVAHFGAVFQRWIQQTLLKELIIDVADYRHVFEGPGVILIGHASDYAIESREGRLGLTYTRKRQLEPNLQTQLRTSFELALAAAEMLEAEESFSPRLKFRTDEIEIRFPDRLNLPNKPETFDLVKDDLAAVLAEVYGGVLNFAPSAPDPRHLFSVAVHHESAAGVSDLLRQLQGSAQPG